jgi:hypothetical protein
MNLREPNEAPFVDPQLRRLHEVAGFLRCPQCGSMQMDARRVVYRTDAQGYFSRRDEAGIERPVLFEHPHGNVVHPVLLLRCGRGHCTDVWLQEEQPIDWVDAWEPSCDDQAAGGVAEQGRHVSLDHRQAQSLLLLVAEAVAAGLRGRRAAASYAVPFEYCGDAPHEATIEGHAQVLYGGLLSALHLYGGYLPTAQAAEDAPWYPVTLRDVVDVFRAMLAGQEGSSDADQD